MERPEIEDAIESLVTKPPGEAPAENESWIAVDGEALIQVFRTELPNDYNELIHLIVRGPEHERKRVFYEFTAVLGVPFVSMKGQESNYDGYTWREEDIGKSDAELAKVGEWVLDASDVNLSTWN